MAAADPNAVRPPLSRERVLRAAVGLADRDGLDALTMRRLAAELGVEAMSLYHHVANKKALLDGVVDVVVDEAHARVAAVDVPDPADDWRGHVRARSLLAREVMLAHPWAPTVIESRTSIPMAVVLWMDAVLGALRSGGFSWDLAHHAMHALGSRALGFAQELFEPDADDGDDLDLDLEEMAAAVPNIVGMLAAVTHDDADGTLGWCDDQTEFEFGLDVLLAGLAAQAAAER